MQGFWNPVFGGKRFNLERWLEMHKFWQKNQYHGVDSKFWLELTLFYFYVIIIILFYLIFLLKK